MDSSIIDSKKKKVMIVSVTFFFVGIIVPSLIVMITSQKFDENEQSISQWTNEEYGVKNTYISQYEVLSEDASWRIISAKVNKNDTNSIYVLHNKNGQWVNEAEPTWTVDIDKMKSIGVPITLIKSLYPEAVLWFGFSDFTKENGSLMTNNIKTLITDYAAANAIDLQYICIVDDSISKKASNMRSENVVVENSFAFQINDCSGSSPPLFLKVIQNIQKTTVQIINQDNEIIANHVYHT